MAAILLGGTTVPAAAHAPAQAAAPRATAITPNGSWPVYHHDDGHTGYDPTQPKAITASTGWTSAALDHDVYGEPLVYQGIVYVATLNNTVYALNQTDGSQVWATHLRAPQTTGWTCGNVSPQGILGTPVIDPASNRIYVATFGSDDVYRLEGLDLATGQATFTAVGITANTSFDWTIQQERGALAVHNGYVYVPFGGRAGDCGSYHGWMFAVPIAGGSVLNYVTPGAGAGFWNAGGVVVDDSTGNVFNTSGNGVASGCDSNVNGTPVFENDAVVRWSATLVHEDAFIPRDWQNDWCGNDEDLGSASMVLISPTLAFQSGKWGNGFLVDPQALGGMDGQLYPSPVNYTGVDVCLGNQHDANFGSYAYAPPYVYLGCDENTSTAFAGRMVALDVNTGAPSFSPCGAACASPAWNNGGHSFGPPIVAGGAVWAVDTSGGTGLYGFDALTGAQIFHSGSFGVTHFTTPSEAGGQIFVGSGNLVRSFRMSPGCLSVSQSANPPSPRMVGGTIVVTAAASGCPNPSPNYEFWVLAPGASLYTLARAYSGTATFGWSTVGLSPGTYRIDVWARDAQSPGAFSNAYGTWDTYDASLYYTLTAGCPGVTQSASPAGGAMITTTVTVTASAPGCPNPTFEFWVLAPGASLYALAQPYGSSATLTWPTTGKAAGTYRFDVWVRDASSAGTSSNAYGSWDAYDASLYYPLTPGCPGVTQSAAPSGGAMVSTSFTVTASAPGCPIPQFEFWVLYPGASLYTLAQQYGGSATLSWSTTGKPAGTYRFDVWVRDASSAGTSSNAYGTWDAYDASLYYPLTPGCPSVGVSATPSSPATVGTSITIAASAPGCPNPSFEYWILYPGASLYTLLHTYTTSTSITWSTTGLAPGTYRINIWVRDASSAGTSSNAYGAWDAYNANTYYALT